MTRKERDLMNDYCWHTRGAELTVNVRAYLQNHIMLCDSSSKDIHHSISDRICLIKSFSFLHIFTHTRLKYIKIWRNKQYVVVKKELTSENGFKNNGTSNKFPLKDETIPLKEETRDTKMKLVTFKSGGRAWK